MTQPLFNTTSFKDNGPLGGFLSGLGDSFSLANADRDLVDRDRRSRFDQLKLEDEEMNTPVRAAKRAEELAKSEYNTDEITSGRKLQQSQADMEVKLQQAIDGKNKNERYEMEKQANGMLKASHTFSDEDAANPLLAQAKWDAAREIAEQHGVKGMPAVYSKEALDRLRQGAKAAVTTIPFLQEQVKTTATEAARAEEHKLNRESQERIASGHDAATRHGADVRGPTATPADKMALKPMLQQLETELLTDVNEGKPIDADKMERYIGLALNKDKTLDETTKTYLSGIKQELSLFPEKRKKLAIALGTPDAGVDDLSFTLARAQAKRVTTEDELKKFEGAEVTKKGLPYATVRGGKIIPIEGSTPPPTQSAPVTGAAPGSPAAPMAPPAAPMGPAQAMPPMMPSEMGGMSLGGGEQLPANSMAPMTPRAPAPPGGAVVTSSVEDKIAAQVTTKAGQPVAVKEGVFMSKNDGDVTEAIYNALPKGAKYKLNGKIKIKG